MCRLLLLPLALATLTLMTADTSAAEKDARVYEMRVYYAPPGKLDALNARFKNHTLKMFEKHGLTNVGYFVPVDNKENKLVYFISAPSKAARDKALQAMGADADWKKAVAESEKDGKLVSKMESRFLTATEYSPLLKVEKGTEERVFELRTYTATKGNLGHLNDRFKNHTIKLFAKHGMTNLIYWNVLAGEKGADDTLIYLLAHKSKEAAAKSFDAFRKDPDWLAARKASEEKGGGSLTAEKNGVVSEFLVPTDYSPLK
ncbi:NIPSNAP family protein [Gemmata sp. JC673]|uniref:NIPSNAP family protein n=1 Tax=Gemmata algarum TaxID=2975278 RepID=A0ABU5EY03_9BACT|nr:NIPSNAP family protein [Gemmata algarum]MDY3560185.1 NIPSNAP family protein [Gemmata algarum]